MCCNDTMKGYKYTTVDHLKQCQKLDKNHDYDHRRDNMKTRMNCKCQAKSNKNVYVVGIKRNPCLLISYQITEIR